MGFLHPAMLWGTLLVAVPIIIYLINRRRYQRRPWAAMEFLLRALKKNRRRLELENLLLLLIRISVLLLLAWAMARPFLRSTPIGILSEKEENWIFAIDTSYSMEMKEGPRSLFEQARESIGEMVKDLVKQRDRIAIVTLDASPQVVLEPSTVTESNRDDLLRGLGELSTGPRSVDIAASLLLIREAAGRFEPAVGAGLQTHPKKIILFSDFQKRDWLSEDGTGPRDPATINLIKEIQDGGGEFALGNLEGSERNLSLLDLSVTPEVVARDVWTEFRASVRNWGKEDFEQVELKFLVDGQEESSLLLRVPAGATLNTPAIPYRFSSAGYHAVTAELRSDGLVIDNRRFLAVNVREESSILIVDGDPGQKPRDRESLYLYAALAPDPTEAGGASEGSATPYRPVVRTDDQLDGVDPRDYVMVVLANVSDLPERFLRDLESYVREGGALLGFLGRKVDPVYYNQELFRQGAGLLPARLEEVRGSGDARSSFHLVPADPEHPLVRYFEERSDQTNIFQEIVEFKQFYRATVLSPPGPPEGAAASSPAGPSGVTVSSPSGPPEGAVASSPSAVRQSPAAVRVPYRFSDPESSPALLDGGFGRGRVLWFLTSADDEWNQLPKWPDFVTFLYQAVPYLVRFGETKINLAVGEPFREVFDAADFVQDVMLIAPGAVSPAATAFSPLSPPEGTAVPPEGAGGGGGGFAKQMTKIEGENRFALVHEETWQPGIYELRLGAAAPAPVSGGGTAGGEQVPAVRTPPRETRQYFAVNLDPREGDLRSLPLAEMKDHFPGLKARTFEREIGHQKSLARGTELWRSVLWAVLLLLVFETFLAQLFGKNQR